jgi:hypothetical protein
MQLKTNLVLTLGYNVRFQGGRDGKIQPAIHFLHWLIKLNRALRAKYAIDIGGNNLVQTDFILKCGANGI